jgi:hypothetical protein
MVPCCANEIWALSCLLHLRNEKGPEVSCPSNCAEKTHILCCSQKEGSSQQNTQPKSLCARQHIQHIQGQTHLPNCSSGNLEHKTTPAASQVSIVLSHSYPSLATLQTLLFLFFFLGLRFELRASHLQHMCSTLEPHLQVHFALDIHIYIYTYIYTFFFGKRGVSLTICPGWPQTEIFLISAFQVARITRMSHQILAI